jgi:hypothetical protein
MTETVYCDNQNCPEYRLAKDASHIPDDQTGTIVCGGCGRPTVAGPDGTPPGEPVGG